MASQGGASSEKDEAPVVHSVAVPPSGGVVKTVGHGLWEMFFYDAPVDQFRGQSKRKKSWLGLQYVFPILSWIFSYTPKMFALDLVAGLTIASLAVPQDLGYAKLAQLPPVNGLSRGVDKIQVKTNTRDRALNQSELYYSR